MYNTARDIFTGLQGVQFYKTIGFKDIAMIHGDTEQSYKKTSKLINRIRYQEQDGTPYRTLHECTEKEGEMILAYIENKTKSILAENGFSEEGVREPINEEDDNEHTVTIQKEKVITAIDRCSQENNICIKDILSNPVPYEDPANSINVAIDDVHVKKQEEKRPGGKKLERGKRKYIHNTIIHASKKNVGKYVLNGHGINNVLLFLTAFIFYNSLSNDRIQFFTDGHKKLNDIILNMFSWKKNIGIILDWYHLEKKCKEQLSRALKGRVIRNDILENLKPLLWQGTTDKAVGYLHSIPEDSVRNVEELTRLIEYLERNKNYIPCYIVRKELGLCNSSAIGEKMNDLVVSKRQKHNGMSWSKTGSVNLATVTALKINKESDKWFEDKELDFKLAA